MSEHVRGPTYARRERPRFEFKPGSPDHSGGGYPRIRSTERRPHTAADGAEDVFVSVHRLCAVAWLFPDGMTAADILSGDGLRGYDVHHESGVPCENTEANLQLLTHDRHSEVTQAEMRAWAADARAAVERDGSEGDGSADTSDGVCAHCGAESDTLCIYPGVTESVCPECAAEADPDGPIEVV